jgi:outer membrane protein OmpA-like peptidoglycan-associated protein
VKAAEKAVSDAAKAIMDKLGKFLAVKLPNGVELNVPEFGVEKKLIAFIEDKSKPVDKTTWFSFDRLDFETGSATLKPSSAEQLKNIAEIMKAYPKVKMKIGGYTDNVGNADANLKLSQKRAENTMQEIVKLGVDAKRLEAEGYGVKHPVADNSTEEGRAKNRRIDLRVTSK